MATTTRPIVPSQNRERRASPADRTDWFFRIRRGPDGEFPRRAYARAVEQRVRAEREQLKRAMEMQPSPPGGQPGGAGSVNWTPIGPSVIASFGSAVSGRITSLAIGPSSSRLYAGADNGGIWFSGDGGTSWAPLDDFVVSPAGSKFLPRADALSVGSLTVKFGATAANDEIYVGTGSNTYFGIGVLHSTSGGAPGSWVLEATNLDDNGIPSITIDPDNPAVVMAATWGGLFKRPLSGSPATWSQVASPAFTNPNNFATALIVAGSGAKKMYYAAFYNDQVYSSPDGTTWAAVPGIAGGSQRIALACGESDPSAVYAFTSASGVVYKLHNNSFQAVNGTPPQNVLWGGGAGQHAADLTIAVDPSNGNTVYLGAEYAGSGLALFKGTISGGPGSYNFGFTNVGNPGADPTYVGSGIHADGHAIAFGLNALGMAHDSTHVWVGCDGGVYGSTASGANGSFKSLNTGLAIAELYHIAQRADTDAVMVAGTQDNGTVRYLGEAAQVEPVGGDGGGVAWDPNNPYQVMGQYGFVGTDLLVSTDGGFSFNSLAFPPITANTPAQTGAAATESGNTNAFAAIVTTPPGVAPTIAGFGTNRLWITKNWGGAWVTLPTNTNPYVPANPDLNQDVIDGTPINAVAFASGKRIFAATARNIWRYDFDPVTMTWNKTIIDTTALPAQRYIFALAVDDPAAGSFYAALAFPGNAHLWYFDGTNWTAAMPTSVIDAFTNTVVVDPSNPNSIYVGTDVGCYQGTHTGPGAWTWQLFSQGLPECVVMDLKIFQSPTGARILRAATYGRGIWEIMLSNATVYNPDVYTRANYCDTGRVTGGVRNSWIEGLPDPTRQGFIVYHYMSPDIKVRRGSLPGLPVLGSPVTYLDFAVNIGDYTDSTTNTETVDLTGPNRFFVQVHNRDPITSVPGTQVKVCLLLADASAGLPALPANYAMHINNRDTNFLAGNQWYFADPMNPYHSLTGTLDARNPQIAAEFDVDFTSAIPGLPMGHDHVCAAAFVSTTVPGVQVTATSPGIDGATMQDKLIAQRNLHLVAPGTTPLAGGERFRQLPEAALIDFHNSTDKEAIAEIYFEREAFPGHISVLLPDLAELSRPGTLHGFKVVEHGGRNIISEIRGILGEALEHIGEMIEKFGEVLERCGPLDRDEADERKLTARDRRLLRKLATLNHKKVYVAESVANPSLSGIRIPAGGFFSAALILRAPDTARPGDKFAFNVLQRQAGKVVGGSAYVVAVTKGRGAAARAA